MIRVTIGASAGIMKRYLFAYCLLLLIRTGYSQESSDPSEELLSLPEMDFKSWIRIERMHSINFKDSLPNIRPIDYLRFLGTFQFDMDESGNRSPASGGKVVPPMEVWKFSVTNAWVTRRDVDTLIRYMNCTQKAKIPISVNSTMIPEKNTTIGIEAMHLISLYRNREFNYPSANSTYYLCPPENQQKLAAEFRGWWSQTKGKLEAPLSGP